ncbi:MAG TPA: hypothetical protein VF185_03570 [Patescibacteria group bacterium]
MLTTQDLLNICLAIGFLSLVAVISFTLIQISLTLKAIRIVAEEVRNTAHNISLFRSEVKIGALSFIKSLLGGRGRR